MRSPLTSHRGTMRSLGADDEGAGKKGEEPEGGRWRGRGLGDPHRDRDRVHAAESSGDCSPTGAHCTGMSASSSLKSCSFGTKISASTT
eukprot:2648253-Rhodomonas_salina.1